MKPLVSIIIPAYNRAHLIGETLDSVIAQTYTNWECIVVDDGSIDYTEELLEFYREKDSRIKYYHRPVCKPKGANACRNFGFWKSKGELVQWLDSDDILSDNKLQVQVVNLEGKGSMSLSICRFGYFKSATDEFVSRENIKTYRDFENGKDLLLYFGIYNEYFPVHAYLIRRKLIYRAKEWNESLEINQDGEFFCRILLLAYPIQFSKTEVFYRIGGKENASLVNNPLKAQRIIDSWKMIQQHLNNENHPYVGQAKKMLYQKLSDKYPELVEENYIFFKSVIPMYIRLIKKLF